MTKQIGTITRTAGAVAAAMFLSLATASTAVAQQNAVIKGGQLAGAFNRWTSAWSIYLSKAIPNVRFSSESSTGSAENMRAVNAGSADFGLVFANDLYDGSRGEGTYKAPLKDVRAMTYVFASVDHFVVPADSSIKTFDDVKGKRISLGGPGSGTAMMITQLMQQVGIWGNITPSYLGGNSPQALANGKIDAYNWSPGLGNAMIRNTAAMMKIRFINLDDPARKSGFYDKYPYYGKIIIPGGLYSGVDIDTPTFGTGSVLTANAKVSDDLVYNFLKAIFSENGRKELSAAVGAASINAMTKDTAFNYVTIPLHPGAERFWKEQGVTIPAKLSSR